MDSTTIYEKVKERYSATALAPDDASYGKAVAEAFGYSAEELASIPAESNLGLSCGNPIALANLKEGETVVDLGSGAGFDCFLAARKVGDTGRVVGVDMNEDMLAKAQTNAQKANVTNVSFISSKINDIGLPDASADVVISNCVINLVPEDSKPLVFKEMHRLLKPNGRAAISDILAEKDFNEEIKNNVALYCGCVAGASRKEEYEKWLKEAGFGEVVVVKTGADLNVYTQTEGDEAVGAICCGPVKNVKKENNGGCGPAKVEKESNGCCGPPKVEKEGGCCGPKMISSAVEKTQDGGVAQDMRTSLKDMDLNEWAGSYQIFAIKGGA